MNLNTVPTVSKEQSQSIFMIDSKAPRVSTPRPQTMALHFNSDHCRSKIAGALMVKNRYTRILGRRLLMAESCLKPSLSVFPFRNERRVVLPLAG